MIPNLVVISPDIQSGTPVFAGTRVPVKNLFDYLKGGDTIDEFLNDFPSVSREQVLIMLSLAEKILTYSENETDENDIIGRKPAEAA